MKTAKFHCPVLCTANQRRGHCAVELGSDKLRSRNEHRRDRHSLRGTAPKPTNPRSEAWTVDALSYLQRALSHLKNGDRVTAMGELNEAIKLNPQIAEAYFTRGSIYAEDKDYDRALQDFDQAISLNPVLTEAFHQRALAHRGKLAFPHALKDLNAAIGMEPFNPRLLRDRGEAYLALGDYDRAVDDYQAAMSIDRSSIDPYSMANLLFFQGRFSQSAQTMQQVLKVKPENPYAMLWRYLAFAKANGVTGSRA